MPREREIPLEAVRALPVGSWVNIHGEDKDGEHRVIECTVASHFDGTEKFLTYRVKGELKSCAIKEYPGKYYTHAFEREK